VSSGQTITVIVGQKGEIDCRNVIISQEATVSSNLISYFKSTDINNLKNQMMDAVNNSLKSDQKSTSPSVTLVPYNEQSTKNIQVMDTRIKSIIENIVRNETFSSCNVSVNVNQQIVFPIYGKVKCGPDGKLQITQKTIIESLANCMTDTVVTNLFKNTQVKELENNAKSSQSQLVSSAALIIIAIVVVIIVLIALYIYVKSKSEGGGNMPMTMPQK
jgi:hypothetical protein